MKKLEWGLALLLGLLLGGSAAAQDAPAFQAYSFDDNAVIKRMSDNGLWAVAEGSSQENAYYSVGARLIDLTTQKAVLLTEGYAASEIISAGARDVTDDGSIVVGEFNTKPAVWNKADGKFTQLPLLVGCNMGYASAVTPDGKYAVGVLSNTNNIYSEVPVMWDLTTNKIINTPGLPTKDMAHLDQQQNRFTDVSPDGNYIVGCMSFSYLPTSLSAGGICQYVYDRKKQTYRMIGFEEHDTEPWSPLVPSLNFVASAVMSNNGQWLTGEAYIVKTIAGSEFPEETSTPYTYNVLTGEFKVFDTATDGGYAGWAVGNDGSVYGATPVSNPYREWSVRSGNYWYGFSLILKQKYGVDFTKKTGIENTGTPISVSNDGKRLAMIIDPYSSYVATLPEAVPAACADVDLLGAYSVTPQAGATLSKLQKIDLVFDRNIDVLGGNTAAEIRDAAGKKVYNSVSFQPDNSGKGLSIRFRSGALSGGQSYTLHIPAGSVCISGDQARKNSEINIPYNGRAAEPVKVVSVYPEDKSSVASLDATNNPIVLNFDTEVIATENASAALYREGESEPFSHLTMSYGGRQIAVYPISAQQLFKGANYKVVIPAGCITDLTGNNGNEEIVLTYAGSYEHKVSYDEKIIFREDFNTAGLTNLLLFDGDKLAPSADMQNWGFADPQNYPWWIVRDDEASTDMAAASHSMYSPAGKSQDWMATPQLHIPDELCVLKFQSQSYKKMKQDRLKVIVWESDEVYNVLNAATAAKILAEGTVVYDELERPGLTEETLTGEWKDNVVSLAAFAGKNIYIAFLNDNEAQSAVMVDNLEVLHNTPFLVTNESLQTVVAQSSLEVKGRITIDDEKETFTSLTLQLRDAQGTVLETISETGLALKKDDSHAFAFAKRLPLTTGEVNAYSILCRLNTTEKIVEATAKNLAFSPVKRIVLEEYTGMTCQNCPLGILAIEKIKGIYGSLFIPVSIHTYPGDAFGTGLSAYSETLNLVAAPSGMINRSGEITFPMASDNQDYIFSGASTGQKLWLDIVQEEMEKPAEAEISATLSLDKAANTLNVPCTVRYALNTKEQQVNLFMVIMEDNVLGYQSNNLASLTDPDLGEWAQGGKYASSTVYPYYHNDVVRACVGRSFSGTGGYIPQDIEAGKEYKATLTAEIPESVSNTDNLKVAVMMIDANTGAIINAVEAKAGDPSGIESAPADAQVGISVHGSLISIAAPAAGAKAYAADGRLLGETEGKGLLQIDVTGHSGVVIVKTATDKGIHTAKVLVK